MNNDKYFVSEESEDEDIIIEPLKDEVKENLQSFNYTTKGYVVLAVMPDGIVLMDSEGSGFKIPLTGSHKDAKKGDTIYF